MESEQNTHFLSFFDTETLSVVKIILRMEFINNTFILHRGHDFDLFCSENSSLSTKWINWIFKFSTPNVNMCMVANNIELNLGQNE